MCTELETGLISLGGTHLLYVPKGIAYASPLPPVMSFLQMIASGILGILRHHPVNQNPPGDSGDLNVYLAPCRSQFYEKKNESEKAIFNFGWLISLGFFPSVLL